MVPFSWLFAMIVAARRFAYRSGLLRSARLPVPVIVVGNITTGGTGKTPLVIWLVDALRKAGHRPGVVSRGYGGGAGEWPLAVGADSDPREAGDEPVLIVRRTGCPLVVDPRRPRAARKLVSDYGCDVIVSDDGLQHYALARDLEIAVIDGARRFGNGRCLPAGPLREKPSRLQAVDMIVVNGAAEPGECSMSLAGGRADSLCDPTLSHALQHWQGRTVHGVAGIGNPERFFAHLRAYGLTVVEHPFPDHHRYRGCEFDFGDELPVMMTEKDAIKCRDFAEIRHWFVPVSAQFDETCRQGLERLLRRVSGGVEAGGK